MRRCLFCTNPVNSAEHIWSDWILKELKSAMPVRITVGRTAAWAASPEVKVEAVCSDCNSGWMSRIEEANKLHIRAMMRDDPCGLTKRDQEKMARWSVLKAMVLDSCNLTREPFYSEAERVNLKNLSTIPTRTLVWLGRFDGKSLNTTSFHAGGTDIWRHIQEVPKAGRGCITTIIVGYLVIQVLSFHTIRQFASQH